MTFKENLKLKIKLDRLFQNLVSTIKEVPGQRRLDKKLARELLDMTDFEHKEVRDLQLYARSLEGEVTEVVVLDNELPIYHTSVEDVALRKSPYWQEIISIRNIIKILNDKDVVASKGKASLKRLHANALALLNLKYTKDDLALLMNDARQGLEQNSIAPLRDCLDLFFAILDFQAVSIEEPVLELQIFGWPKPNGNVDPAYEPLIFFDEEKRSVGLKKGTFSQHRESDMAWIERYSRGEEQADLNGIDVFEFLSELALERLQD